tara:strand:+ start:4460 stop:5365 length:906 start_codon:yes stop_codon:yes gene_type:complete
VSPTIFYWLNIGISKIVNPRKLEKNYLNNFKTIILVRYIPFNIIIDLIVLKRRSIKIILLLDDNLLDLNIFSELPFLYKIKIFINIYCYKFFFNLFINQIWVTNKLLGEKVKQKIPNNNINIQLLKLDYNQKYPLKKSYKIAYLGTSSHTKELYWLKTLFEKLQQQRNDCLIEIYVNKKWRNYFRSVPRIKMSYPLDWETFFFDTTTGKVDIVLNPIFKSNFNNFRSPTKFFDITRLEAVGIYSNLKPFRGFINHNHDGILLDNNIDDWIEKISFLLDNSDVREKLFLNALKRSENPCNDA